MGLSCTSFPPTNLPIKPGKVIKVTADNRRKNIPKTNFTRCGNTYLKMRKERNKAPLLRACLDSFFTAANVLIDTDQNENKTHLC